jgi:hypothetical protein
LAVIEEEIRQVVAAAPARRRLQARAALTGSADDLIKRIREVRAVPDGGWQANLSAWYMLDFAARHRPTAEVAAIAREFCDEDIVLETSAERAPAELAEIAAGLSDSFLHRLVARLPPADLAELLVVLQDQDELAGKLRRALILSSPGTIARTVVHLRGMEAGPLVADLLVEAAGLVASRPIAVLLALLAELGDHESAQVLINAAAAWHERGQPAVPDVGRITQLVQDLLDTGHELLGRRVVDRTVPSYALSSERYRLYALVFVFKKRGLDVEADQVITEIGAGTSLRGVAVMVLDFCKTQQPEQAAVLIRALLRNPAPDGTAEVAATFARELHQAHEDIFATVAAWSYPGLIIDFEHRLASDSDLWAQEFRKVVSSAAHLRVDGTEIADLVNWLYEDVNAKRGNERANTVLTGVAERQDAALMVAMICRLREAKTWRALRDTLNRNVCDCYDAEAMAALITKSVGTCLPAALWLAQDWLTRRARTDADIVRVVRGLRDAHGNPDELRSILVWSGRSFLSRLDGTNPLRAIEAAGLTEQANAWYRGQTKTLPVRKPDPDPPR